METVVERITPDIATKYLEANVHNRPVHQRHVEFLAEEIKQGRWKMNGSSIVFNGDGTLIDGQHRLWAVITSGLPIKILVVRGADEGSFATIDTGMARTAGDVLGIIGEKNPANLAGAARFIMAYESKFQSNRKKGSNTKVVEFVKKNPGLANSVEFLRRTGGARILSKAIAGGLHYLMSKKDAALADELFTGIAKGFAPEAGETFMALREKLIANAAASHYVKGPTIAVYVIKAWNARREGKYIRVFRFADGEEIPKIK
jgi:hypothetical protein